ncbi:MAG: pyridoxal-phosphate dependent enzyme [Enterobacterales bacterium]|nr:pyridoxal-phosphate dependent enzyme [Enterobacterales bacterium]
MESIFQEIKQATKAIKKVANKTPVLKSTYLDQQQNCEIYFKCENFQKVGAFKFRGAFNAMRQLSPQQKQKGVIAYSSGNHAQAVALVGQMLSIKTTLVMPSNAPKIKQQATRDYGAKVVLFDPQKTSREAVAADLNGDQQLTLIKPFDDLRLIAGQATAAVELIEEVGELDFILAPCGGGGLLSGTAVATKNTNPNCQVIGVEPKNADDATRSFYSGVLHSNPNPDTIADGTRTTCLGEITFPLIQQHVDQMITVSEEQIKQAVRFFFYRMKIVVEPSGALGLAAILSGALKINGKVGVIVSGGNIDASLMADILQG